MAGKVKVVVNQRAIAELVNSDEVHRGIEPRAERVLEKARADAPVLSGEYRNGLHIADATVNGVRGFRIGGSSDHDIYVEAQTGNLARALDAAGGS